MSEAVELELLPVNPCTGMRGLPTVRYEEPVLAHGRQGLEMPHVGMGARSSPLAGPVPSWAPVDGRLAAQGLMRDVAVASRLASPVRKEGASARGHEGRASPRQLGGGDDASALPWAASSGAVQPPKLVETPRLEQAPCAREGAAGAARQAGRPLITPRRRAAYRQGQRHERNPGYWDEEQEHASTIVLHPGERIQYSSDLLV